MNAGVLLAAACEEGDPGYCAPSSESFIFKHLADFEVFGVHLFIDKVTLFLFLGVIVVAVFFLLAARRAAVVPGRLQFLGESIYGFIRNDLGRDIIGPEGVKFAPYLATLFSFVLINNLFGIIPPFQMPVTSRIAYPIVLAVLSWLIFNYVGLRRKGVARYFGQIMFPPGVPKPVYVLLTPIELVSTLVVRPLTLALRLFANMFAGHLLLLVFFSGAAYLLTVGNFSAVFGPMSLLMGITLTGFELLVEVLQAYIFTLLTSLYVAGALAEEH